MTLEEIKRNVKLARSIERDCADARLATPESSVSLEVVEFLLEEIEKRTAALEFYASEWRSDVYVGPTEELIKDFGTIAREALGLNEGEILESQDGI